MTTRFTRLARRIITRLFPGKFPGLYSTLDNPQRVPVQDAAYRLTVSRYLNSDDKVLDVGFGLGYGLEILSAKAKSVSGIEIDRRAVAQGERLFGNVPALGDLQSYNGKEIPYERNAFDVVTCVDVLEHVPDYVSLILEMLRVSSRLAVVSTPSRRLEFTRKDGHPCNRWHLREWSYEELDAILRQFDDIRIEWNFLIGSWEGPFVVSSTYTSETLALTPVLFHI